MTKNLWITLVMMISGAVLAEPAATNPPPAAAETAPAETPAAASTAATNPPMTKAPARRARKKKAAAKKSPHHSVAITKTEPLVAGPATVIASNVNVRGQAKLRSEVIGKVTKGDAVTVLDEVHLKNSGPEEPSAWAKIVLPASIHPWVSSLFINPSNHTVVPRRLKLRGGPGENYSVLGIINRGETVTPVNTKGDWIEIEALPEAYGFMAAQYLKQEPAGTTNAPEVAAATPETVTNSPAIAPAAEPALPPSELAATNPPAAVATAETNAPAAEPAETNETAAVEEPPPPRIVQREGIVRGTFSIQAPTRYELISLDNHRPINYLYSDTKELDLSQYKGLHIIVTGEEGLDERWRNTPVITIQKIQVLE
ncbi:MAG TPA: SH3 domain-containing protein [Verrucomicrobiae bacterium]|nr:SH3 domain-containing protein [Verrucomicrobiae bacterium]